MASLSAVRASSHAVVAGRQVPCQPHVAATRTRPFKQGFLQQRPTVQQRGGSRLAAQKQKFGSFDEMVQKSELPVLVEFYATWCGPCQMMGRTLEAVAPSVKDRVQFVKIDSEKYERLASRYGIQGLPTLILFKGGRQVDRLEGMLPEPDFRRWLAQHI